MDAGRCCAGWLLGGLAAAAVQAASPQPLPTLTATRLQCEPVYLPQRSVWSREVTLWHSRQTLKAVEVDGIRVHSFRLAGRTVLTALDNERIRIDLNAGLWHSDLRGMAEGQGPCTVMP